MIKDQLVRTIALPKGWARGKLGEIAQYINGRAFKPKEWEKKGLPIIRIQNLNKPEATYNYSSKVFEEKYLVKYGELLFAWSASLGAYIWGNQDAWLNQHIFKVLPEKGINKLFLYYALTSITSELYAKAHGSGMVHVTKKKFENTEIGVPPLPEQHRIVAKIESLFTQLDKGVEQLTAIQQQLKTYRQAVLKAAFEGKLTAAWREQHQPPPASELLAQIKAERERQYEQEVADWKAAVREWEAEGPPASDSGGRGRKPGKPRKLKENPELTAADLGELTELPNGWMWEKLGNLSIRIQIGPFGSQLHREDYIENGIPLINPKNIKDQKIYPDHKVSIPENIFRAFPQYWLKEGDIIMGRRGEMGRCAPISFKENMWFCGTGSLFIRLTKFSNHILFSLIIGGQEVVKYLDDNAVGTTMKNLNSTILSNIPIPVISHEEQHQIVQEIESRLSICDQLEKTIVTSLVQAEALRQSILKKAFEGKLVPQDPADEPAGVLLERIRREKEKT